MSFAKAQRCAKLIKKPGMPEARPCLRKKGHRWPHTPDLTGLKDVFGYAEILRKGPPLVQKDGRKHTRWVVRDRFGDERLVNAHHLFNGWSSGKVSAPGSGLGTVDKFGKSKPEYATTVSHWDRVFNENNRQHRSYKHMVFSDDWNPDKGGSFSEGMNWILKNLGPKPGLGWQLHVLKTKKYPHGFFGPDDKDGRHIVWRHRADRHDQDLLDLIHEWPKKKLREFVRNEIRPLLKAA